MVTTCDPDPGIFSPLFEPSPGGGNGYVSINTCVLFLLGPPPPMTCSSFLLDVAMGLVLSREVWEGCCLLPGLPVTLSPLPPTGPLPSGGWSRRQRAGAWGPE